MDYISIGMIAAKTIVWTGLAVVCFGLIIITILTVKNKFSKRCKDE